MRPCSHPASIALAAVLLATAGVARAQSACGDRARVDRFGEGGVGSGGVPRVDVVGAPVVGESFGLRVVNGPPGGAGVLVVGSAAQDHPFASSSATLHVAPPWSRSRVRFDAFGVSPTIVSHASLPPFFCGTVRVAQAFAYDATAAGGLSFSAGAECRIGARPSVDASPLFSAASFECGDEPRAVEVADIDQDGLVDLVVADHDDVDVKWLRGLGRGSFAEAQTVFAFGRMRDLAVGDLDQDGVADLVVANHELDRVLVRLGTGGGTFAAVPGTHPVGDEPHDVALADVDLDGVLDVVVTNIGSSDVSILLGAGDGTFATASTVAGGTRPVTTALADIDGDGLLDLHVLDWVGEAVRVSLGTGGGAFGPAQTYVTGTLPRKLALEDLDADGSPDLVVLSKNDGDVQVRLGDGAGGYGPAQLYGVASQGGSAAVALAVADQDLDGAPDVFVFDRMQRRIAVLRGGGDGSLEPPRTWMPTAPFPGSAGAHDLVCADLDTGGELDLLLLDHTVLVYPSPAETIQVGPPPPAPGSAIYEDVIVADLDRDGVQDYVASRALTDRIDLWFGAGDGDAEAVVSWADGDGTFDYEVVDMDGDGLLDLVTSNAGSDEFLVALGTGGSFGPPISSPAGPDPLRFALGDLDSDGNLDAVVVQGGGAPGVGSYLGAGDGTFAQTALVPIGDMNARVTLGDLDQDGALDLLVVLDTLLNEVEVRAGLGDGTFGPVSTFPLGGEGNFREIATADLNEDGAPDLVVMNDDSADISVLLGQGDGTLGPSTEFDATEPSDPFLSLNDLALGDLDEDGHVDLVAVGGGLYVRESLVLLRGRGDGTFDPVRTFAGVVRPFAVDVGDVDGDGVLDVVTTYGEPPYGIIVTPNRLLR